MGSKFETPTLGNRGEKPKFEAGRTARLSLRLFSPMAMVDGTAEVTAYEDSADECAPIRRSSFEKAVTSLGPESAKAVRTSQRRASNSAIKAMETTGVAKSEVATVPSEGPLQSQCCVIQ